MNEIAVLVDIQNNIASLFDAISIKVYKKELDGWEECKNIPVNMDKISGIGAVRNQIFEIINSLGECRIIVGKEISGVSFNVLDAAGFSIFELVGDPIEILDVVITILEEDNSNKQEASNTENAIPAPEMTDIEGNFFINLTEAQKSQPGVSSKKILLPFLKNETFHSLEVLCSHVPPWFDVEIKAMNLLYETEKVAENNYKVTIFHKTCED